MSKLILYHGSNKIVSNPVYGEGKSYNDYGQGFYCTENIELAKEWACKDERGGFLNTYSINMDSLKVLRLDEADVLEWLAILIKNRKVRYSSPVEKRMAEYIIDNFSFDISKYDVIIGYRANDSYFSFVRAFLSNTISLEQLSMAMKYGNLGYQVFIKSGKAFENLKFVEYEFVSGEEYFKKRSDRDNEAREQYNRLLENEVDTGIFARDIVKKGLKRNGSGL